MKIKKTHNKWTAQEIEFLKENYICKDALYICNILGRSKSAIKHKAKILGLIKKTLPDRWSEDNLRKIIKESKNYSQACLKIGLKGCGNRKTLKKYINIYKIDISHFEYNLSVDFKRKSIPLSEILVENSTFINTVSIKNKLYNEGLKEKKCEECGQGELWRNKKMSLILDHINGINNDNRLSNLRILCPNCNSTTETFCRGHKNKVKKNNKSICQCGNNKCKESVMCIECFDKKPKRKFKRPDYYTLVNQVNDTSYCAVGRLYGVSDNSIRHWIKNYEKDLK